MITIIITEMFVIIINKYWVINAIMYNYHRNVCLSKLIMLINIFWNRWNINII